MTPAGQGFDITLLWLIAGWTVLGLGALLLLWALFRDRSRGRRRCPKCWYDMTGVPGLRCPECGREAKREKKFFKTRPQWRWVLLAILLMCGGFVTTYVPTVRDRGVLSVLPRPVIRIALWLEKDRAKELCDAALVPSAGPTGWRPIGAAQSNTSLVSLLPPRTATPDFDQLLVASEVARRLDAQRYLGDRAKISELVQVLVPLGRDAWPAAHSVAGAMMIGVDPEAGNLLASLVVGGDGALHRALEDQALNGDSIDARRGAMDALVVVALAGPDTFARFSEVLAQSKDPSVAEEIVKRAVAAWGVPQQQVLLLAARHPDPEFRRVASVTFASLKTWDFRFDEFAELLLIDSDPLVRAPTLESLAHVNGFRQVWGMAVVRACEDEDARVRKAGRATLRSWRNSQHWSEDFLREWLALRDIEALLPTGNRVLATWVKERLEEPPERAENAP